VLDLEHDWTGTNQFTECRINILTSGVDAALQSRSKSLLNYETGGSYWRVLNQDIAPLLIGEINNGS
jgi:hypothetical protein